MKKLLFVSVLFYSSFSVAIVRADGNDLGISFDATWVSKYIWNGLDIYDDHCAFQPSVNFDLYGTGLSINVWTSYAGGGGFRNLEEYDYTFCYSSTVFDGEKMQADYAISWAYFDLYDGPSRDNDSQELKLHLAWPEVFGGKVVPYYELSYYTAVRGGGVIAESGITGFLHLFGFDYQLMEFENNRPLTFGWDIAYNDGQGGTSSDHEWAYMTWKLSTSLKAFGGTITPTLYYQTSMDSSYNPEDELWAGVSYGFDF